jgi:hypothetical protein
MTTKKADEPKATYPELDEKPAVTEPEADPQLAPHPDYPGLNFKQVEQARASARKKLEAARVKAAMQRAEDAELERLKMEEGMVVGGSAGEMVEIDLQMPVVAYGKSDTDAWIQINGRRYKRGRNIVHRSLAHDLLYIADRMQKNESARLGQDSFAFYQQKHPVSVSRVGSGQVNVVRH